MADSGRGRDDAPDGDSNQEGEPAIAQEPATNGSRQWQVRILLDAQADAAAVARHLERFGCRVVELRPHGVLLEFPNASSSPDAVAEARLYLAMWRAHHPLVEASLAPHPPTAA
jgi:hypothetical protein